MNEPTLLLADEPTGALDSAGATEVLELFRRLHSGGQTILLVTHDERVAEAAERVVSMRDGRIHHGASEPAPFSGKDRSVAAVRMRLRAELRSRWRAWLALAVLAGLGAGLVIATAAAARRTDDAVARYRAAAEVFDVWVGKNEMSAGGLRPRREAAAGGAGDALGRRRFLGPHRRRPRGDGQRRRAERPHQRPGCRP